MDDHTQKTDTPPEWVCMKCAKANQQAGPGEFCKIHPDEPFLDGNKDEVKFEMMAADDKARSRLYGFWLLVMGGGLFLAAVTILQFVPLLDDWHREILIGSIFGGTALGFLLAKVMYKPKFRKWTRTVDPGGEPTEPWPSL